MTQIERVHIGDLFIGGVLLVSQVLIGLVFFTRARKGLTRRWFQAGASVLFLLWICSALGLILGVFPFVPVSPGIRGFSSAVETMWGFVSAIAIVIYLIYRQLANRLPQNCSPGRRRLIRAGAAAAMAAPAVLATYGAFIERTSYRVREIDFPVPNLHPDLAGLRIAQISDLHVSPFLSVREAGRVVDITNELKPNLTLVTGDLISESGDPLDATIAELARLRADAGVLGCLGNHEIYAGCENYATEAARRVGIVFLRRESRRLTWGKGVLNVAGVDYQSFHRKAEYLRGAEKLIVPGASNLLLSHNPDVFPLAVTQGYDAVLAGHTHGGQVTVEILNQTLNFAKFFTPYVAGLYRKDGRSCYVTAGIGTIGMPVRTGAPPEITLLRLRRA